MTDDIDKLIERLRNPKLNSEDMCSIPLRYEAVEALRSQQVEIDRQDAVIARLADDEEFTDSEQTSSAAEHYRNELLTRIEYARANRKPESNDG